MSLARGRSAQVRAWAERRVLSDARARILRGSHATPSLSSCLRLSEELEVATGGPQVTNTQQTHSEAPMGSWASTPRNRRCQAPAPEGRYRLAQAAVAVRWLFNSLQLPSALPSCSSAWRTGP